MKEIIERINANIAELRLIIAAIEAKEINRYDASTEIEAIALEIIDAAGDMPEASPLYPPERVIASNTRKG